MRSVFSLLLSALLVVAPALPQAKSRTLKPGWNIFSKDQDVQLGREAASQVEREMPVVRDEVLNGYLTRLGQRLVAAPEADKYPYTFKWVNDPNINAFALPGGPTYFNTGLILNADNEGQLVGVLAHEISHVALRHGTHQVSKANAIKLPAMLLGAVVGGGSMLGQLTQLGIGLGANSLLLKYSRDAERDADLLGARMMARAGYNPLEMARFFEKLEAQGGQRMPQFLSSHPNPGNRVQSVENEIRTFSRQDYNADSGEFQRMKARVQQLPKAPAPRQGGGNLPSGGAPPNSGEVLPTGRFKEYRANDFSLRHPENWEAFGDQTSSSVTIAPRAGLRQGQNGVQIGYGVIVSLHEPPQGRRVDLQRDTQDLIRQLQQSNQDMTPAREGARRTTVDGRQALITTLYSRSPFEGQREVDMLVTMALPERLLYLVFIGPEQDFSKLQGTYEEMLRSVRVSQ
ncbi:MAG: M48 family metallopeptidase [Bryobacteraceae bacterium]|nr:M48 family metallopeptidase [Bryobacteraceae bacterium]